MQEDLITIDRLEDQLIDHPDASTKQDLTDLSLDETFQKKLNERAEQISQQSEEFQFLILKPELEYSYEDYGSLMKELNEWFCYHDFKVIDLKNLPNRYHERLTKYGGDDHEIKYLKRCIYSITSESLDSLTYYIFGKYQGLANDTEQIDQIRNNCKVVLSLGLFEMIITFLKTILPKLHQDDVDATDYFKGLTIFYFLINFSIHNNDNPYYVEMRRLLSETKLINDIIKTIELWKINPNVNIRIRYLILVLWKLLIIELGDFKMIKNCKEFLNTYHNIQKTGKKTSPLDYYSFREDLIDKYPLFDGKQFTRDPYDFKQFSKTLNEDNSSLTSRSRSSSVSSQDHHYFMAMNEQNSLSKFLSTPRPNKSHTVHSQLPAPTVHLSTPVPSPPSTPSDFMSGGEKIRKSYQVNQSMPLIYPNLKGDIPFAIQEAEEILKNSVYDSYSNKRLWDERQKFMAQERGYINEYEQRTGMGNPDQLSEPQQDHEGFDYDEVELIKNYPHKALEIHSICRVESIYKDNLEKFNSLVSVLLETLKLNKFGTLEYMENQLNGEIKFDQFEHSSMMSVNKVLIQQLEVLKIREITQMACSSILVLCLKWFKINHVLKYWYFLLILFDHSICSIVTEFLDTSFINPHLTVTKDDHKKVLYQNRLMNPIITLKNLEFFNNCIDKTVKISKYQLINKLKLEDFSVIENNKNKIKIDKFNKNFAFLAANLLQILNKVLLKNYTQRILTLNELKPTDLLKMIVTNYNCPPISMPIYKILKKLVPYQGRKWKSLNMDLISMIYLNCDLNMRDNWLSGRDLESEFNNSFDQEISLRGLIQFYHLRKYGNKMIDLGYEVKEMFNLDDDFVYL